MCQPSTAPADQLTDRSPIAISTRCVALGHIVAAVILTTGRQWPLGVRRYPAVFPRPQRSYWWLRCSVPVNAQSALLLLLLFFFTIKSNACNPKGKTASRYKSQRDSQGTTEGRNKRNLLTFDLNEVRESREKTDDGRRFHSLTPFIKNELIYCSVLHRSTTKACL